MELYNENEGGSSKGRYFNLFWRMHEKEGETYGNMDGGDKRWGKAWNNIQGGLEYE